MTNQTVLTPNQGRHAERGQNVIVVLAASMALAVAAGAAFIAAFHYGAF